MTTVQVGTTNMAKYRQYAGSPDVFDTATGKAITYEEAVKAGDIFGSAQKGYGGGGLSSNVELINTPRPDIKTEADFSKVAGTAISPTSQAEMTKEEFARQKGVDVSQVRGLPGNFFTAGSNIGPLDTTDKSPESDTSARRNTERNTADKIRSDLEAFGLQQSKNNEIDPISKSILDDNKKRQAEMDKRREEDIARITKEYETAGEEQKISQEEARAKAEGRTRIGGFITKMETDEIQALERKFRLENVALEGQKMAALQTAQRAYNDQDFQLAQAQLEIAQNIEKTSAEKKQNYFNNVLKLEEYYEKLNKPLRDLQEKERDQVLEWMEKAPEQFSDVEPIDLDMGTFSYGEARARWLQSDAYKLELRGQKADVLRKEDLADGGDNDVEIASSDKIKLLGAGFSSAEISQIESDVSQFGIDSVLEGIDDEKQKKVIQDVYGVGKGESKLTRENLATLFGIPDNDEKTGFMGFFGQGKTNKEKLDELMSAVEKYKAVGYSDDEILKLMK